MDNTKTIILTAIAVILTAGGFTYWQMGNKTDAEARVAKLKSEIPDENKLRTDLAQAKAELSDYGVKLEHLEQSVPGVAYVPTLLRELEALGNKSQIVVTGVRPIPAPPATGDKEKDKKKTYQELDIDITGRGNYKSVMTMVDSLKTFPKIVAVTTVGLVPKRDGNNKQSDMLDATVRLKAYMFRDDQDKAKTTDKSNPSGKVALHDFKKGGA